MVLLNGEIELQRGKNFMMEHCFDGETIQIVNDYKSMELRIIEIMKNFLFLLIMVLIFYMEIMRREKQIF